MNSIKKLVRYATDGTLFVRIRKKINKKRASSDRYYGEVAKDYLKIRLQQESWHLEQDIIRELLKEAPYGARVLDVPFGTGRFVDMYLDKGMSIYGVDISQDMLRAARDALGPSYDRCNIYVGSAESLPYASDFFDLVVCFRFFGLISMDMANKVLAEIRRVTSDKAIIRVPVRKEAAGAVLALKPHDRLHGKLLESQIVAMFSASGFSVSATKFITDTDEISYRVYVLTKNGPMAHR